MAKTRRKKLRSPPRMILWDTGAQMRFQRVTEDMVETVQRMHDALKELIAFTRSVQQEWPQLRGTLRPSVCSACKKRYKRLDKQIEKHGIPLGNGEVLCVADHDSQTPADE